MTSRHRDVEAGAAQRIDRPAAALGLLTVVLANLKYLAGLAGILDPVTSMEPYYIAMAARPVADIAAGDPAWGPLYALWLKGFGAVLADPLAIHAANVRVLSLAVSVAFYAFLLARTRRAAFATAGALIFLISDLNVPLPSKVCSFAILVVLAGFTAAELVPRGWPRLAVCAAATLLAGYARPELYAAGLCLWLAAIWQARRERSPASLGWLLGGSAAVTALALTIGTPLWSLGHDDGRLFGALREHYAWNWMRWHDRHLYFAAIWEQDFGAADGVFAALLANPIALARHVATNVAGVLHFVVTGIFAHAPVLAPAAVPSLARLENGALTAAALAAVAIVVSNAARRRRWKRMLEPVGLPIAALALSSIGAASLIYPAPHYLAPVAVLALLASVAAASTAAGEAAMPSPVRRAALAALAVAAVPTPFALPADSQPPGWKFTGEVSVSRVVTDTVHQVRSLGLPPPVHVLTFTDGIGELMGEGFTEVKIWGKGEQSLESYVRQRHVDVIVTMERGRESFLVDDPYWQLIETDPQEAGFTRLPTRDPRAVRVYVRSELLSRPPSSAE